MTNEKDEIIDIDNFDIEEDLEDIEAELSGSNRSSIKYSLGGEKYPVVMLRGLVVFPHTNIKFDVSRQISLTALRVAQAHGGKVLVVAQKEASLDAPTFDDLYTVGTLCNIESVMKENESIHRVLVSGISRQNIIKFSNTNGYVEAVSVTVDDQVDSSYAEESGLRVVMQLMMDYMKVSPQMMPSELLPVFADTTDSSEFADVVASNTVVKFQEAQTLLEEFLVDKRLQKLSTILAREIELLKISNKIMTDVKHSMDRSQRDYFLREQLKAIEKELGDDDEDGDDNLPPATEYKNKIEASDMPDNVREKALEEAKRLRHMQFGSAEASVIET